MDKKAKIPDSAYPRIIVVGGGFAGLELVRKLAKLRVQVLLIDKKNHHTFQPLLYQIATAAIEPELIIYPFRKFFERYDNVFYRLAEVIEIKTNESLIETSIGQFHYNYLVVATGAETNYYGNKDIQQKAISIKSVEDAQALRNTILVNFEKALQTDDQEQLNRLMDYVIVGGGPTGVELAGALSELKKHVFPKDYKELNFVNMDIHLVQSGNVLLKGMSEKASRIALETLEQFGVKVWLNSRVKSYDGTSVMLDTGERLSSHTLIWAAGVRGALLRGISSELIQDGRYITDAFNQVSGLPNVFAIGDIAFMKTTHYPNGLPMLAQPAIQQGRHLARNFKRRLEGKALIPFQYKDQGVMATIGRNSAVADLKLFGTQFRTGGFFAWLIWILIHLISIIGFRNRFFVLVNWMDRYFNYNSSMRLILGDTKENLTAEAVAEKSVSN